MTQSQSDPVLVRVSVRVNAETLTRQVYSDDSLLSLLHDHKLTAAKLGCGQGECGACTVLLGGKAITACNTSFSDLHDKSVVTLEGLLSAQPLLGRLLYEAFIEEQAAQCAYCTSGIMMKGAELILGHLAKTRQEFALALDGNLCRCGSHHRILNALIKASERFDAARDCHV